MIDEGAAAGAVAERPAEGVLDEARTMLSGGDFPEFFQANAVFLRFRVGIEAELGDDRFRK